MSLVSPSYKGHRYPVEIISHCVWLYFRFPLSFRAVEELMLERGVIVSYETVRHREWSSRTSSAPYGAAHREVMPSVEHRSHKGLNNQVENSHQPTRQRERAMKGFRSTGGAQRFPAAFSGISPHFRPRRHLLTAAEHRAEMSIRFAIWEQVTGVAGRPTAA
ncbi:DDE-type integrase/transposase/recombinase [Streptomyces sp. Lzd4kr]|nr:DDE-type integrase/transposase/recombinase [Streptomyces sp. Lzd4kr]